MRIFAATAAVALVGALSLPASAVVTTTGNAAAFDASITLATPLVTFTGRPNVSYTAAQIAAGVDFGFFTVTGSGAPFTGDIAITGEELELFVDDNATPTFTFVLDAPVTSFGAIFDSINADGVSFTFSGGAANTSAAFTGNGSGVDQFAGFTSSTPFTSFVVGPGFDLFTLDNLRFGNAVPEPTSLAVLALAGGLLRRRRA